MTRQRLCYIDTRPRAPKAVFSMEVAGPGYVQLKNTETGWTHIESSFCFNRNYEAMKW